MKRLGPIVGAMLLLGASALAQTTAVTGTPVDSDSTTWTNAPWVLSFVPGPSDSNPAHYTIGGVPLTQSVAYQKGTSDSSTGAITFTTYRSTSISPIGSSWNMQVCPNASSTCATIKFSTGASSLNISSMINAAIIAPRFHPISGTYGYNDGEAILSLLPGSTYYNVTTPCQRNYDGSTWSCSGNGSGTVSAGMTGQITYYPANGTAVQGASGGLTNGPHWALGAGASLNNAPTSTPEGLYSLSSNSIVDTEETTTDPNYQTGEFMSLTLNPSSTSGTNTGAIGSFKILNLTGTHFVNNSNVAVGAWAALTTDIVSPNQLPNISAGAASGVYHSGTATMPDGIGYVADAFNLSTGTITSLNGLVVNAGNTVTGTVSTFNGLDINYFSGSGGTETAWNGLHIETPFLSGDTLTGATIVGLRIEDMTAAGSLSPATVYAIYSADPDASYFAGPMQAPQIQYNTLYSAAGTPLPTCDAGAKGTTAIVSDATLPTYLGTYASGGAVQSPVMCNGTNWVTY